MPEGRTIGPEAAAAPAAPAELIFFGAATGGDDAAEAAAALGLVGEENLNPMRSSYEGTFAPGRALRRGEGEDRGCGGGGLVVGEDKPSTSPDLPLSPLLKDDLGELIGAE